MTTDKEKNRQEEKAPRSRRDSSLYRNLKRQTAAGAGGSEADEIQRSLKETAEKLNYLTAELNARKTGSHGYTNTRWEESNTRFVLRSKNPEVVPVDHQAVIEELTASLEQIDTTRKQLEANLAKENPANKLQIAQIKGRLADLARRKKEIEGLLSSGNSSD